MATLSSATPAVGENRPALENTAVPAAAYISDALLGNDPMASDTLAVAPASPSRSAMVDQGASSSFLDDLIEPHSPTSQVTARALSDPDHSLAILATTDSLPSMAVAYDSSATSDYTRDGMSSSAVSEPFEDSTNNEEPAATDSSDISIAASTTAPSAAVSKNSKRRNKKR
jgi:hypothetical protein